MTEKLKLEKYIRDIPDWPVKGVLFRDITPLLGNSEALKQAIELMAVPFNGEKIDYVAAIESRGFIFGSVIAVKLGAGFVPIRKKGKLPFKTQSISYDLEYGVNTVEIHCDAIKKNAKVLLVDDVLATGGTMAAAAQLIEKSGGSVIGITLLIELTFLHGREKLSGYPIKTVITY